MKLTGYKVYRGGELLYDNVDIEIPDNAFGNLFREKVEWISKDLIETVNFQTVDGGDIRKGAIDV